MSAANKLHVAFLAVVVATAAATSVGHAQGAGDASLDVTIRLLPENAVGPGDLTRRIELPPAAAPRGRDPFAALKLLAPEANENELKPLLALVEQARPGQVRFLVVGDGPYEQEVRARAPRGTVLTGKLHGTALSEAFASGDVFLFPSTTDTFGNVILEAQASGLPVIVSDIGGPRDLVSHGIDGLISKGHDAGELTEAIRTLASDSTLRIKMGKAARVRVESRNWTEAFECFWNASPE